MLHIIFYSFKNTLSLFVKPTVYLTIDNEFMTVTIFKQKRVLCHTYHKFTELVVTEGHILNPSYLVRHITKLIPHSFFQLPSCIINMPCLQSQEKTTQSFSLLQILLIMSHARVLPSKIIALPYQTGMHIFSKWHAIEKAPDLSVSFRKFNHSHPAPWLLGTITFFLLEGYIGLLACKKNKDYYQAQQATFNKLENEKKELSKRNTLASSGSRTDEMRQLKTRHQFLLFLQKSIPDGITLRLVIFGVNQQKKTLHRTKKTNDSIPSSTPTITIKGTAQSASDIDIFLQKLTYNSSLKPKALPFIELVPYGTDNRGSYLFEVQLETERL